MTGISSQQIVAWLVEKFGLVTPEAKARLEELAKQFPDGQIPAEEGARLLVEQFTPENLVAKVPEFGAEVLRLVREGPHEATHHPEAFHP